MATNHSTGAPPDLDGSGMRIALACARFNDTVVGMLLDGAREGLAEAGVPESGVSVVFVPGSFELPLIARALATSGEFDAVVCLGVVIRGETGHYEFVAGECASGIQRVQLDTGVPVMFGVLTTENLDQALERADTTRENKGREVAQGAVEMVQVLRQIDKRGD